MEGSPKDLIKKNHFLGPISATLRINEVNLLHWGSEISLGTIGILTHFCWECCLSHFWYHLLSYLAHIFSWEFCELLMFASLLHRPINTIWALEWNIRSITTRRACYKKWKYLVQCLITYTAIKVATQNLIHLRIHIIEIHQLLLTSTIQLSTTTIWIHSNIIVFHPWLPSPSKMLIQV